MLKVAFQCYEIEQVVPQNKDNLFHPFGMLQELQATTTPEC